MRTLSLYFWIGDVRPFYHTAPKDPIKSFCKQDMSYSFNIIIAEQIYRKSWGEGWEVETWRIIKRSRNERSSGFNGKHRWNQSYCLAHSRAETLMWRVIIGRQIETQNKTFLLRWTKCETMIPITLIQRKSSPLLHFSPCRNDHIVGCSCKQFFLNY